MGWQILNSLKGSSPALNFCFHHQGWRAVCHALDTHIYMHISSLQSAKESQRAALVQILILVERVEINFKAFLLRHSLNGQMRRVPGLT